MGHSAGGSYVGRRPREATSPSLALIWAKERGSWHTGDMVALERNGLSIGVGSLFVVRMFTILSSD